MKIAIFTSSLDISNGWGRYSVNLIHALQAKGVECLVFTEDDARPPLLKTNVISLRSRPGSGWLNMLNVFRDWWRIRKILFSVDIVHTFTETHVFLAWLSGRPYVVSTHGTYTLRFFKRALLRNAAIRAFNQASAVIITSAFTKERIDAFVTLHRTSLLPNGVDMHLFHEHGHVARQAHSFITVGAIKPRKGQDIGIHALAKLLPQFPDARYVIIGKKEFKTFYDKLLSLINELHLEEHVVFEHDVSDARLGDLYNEAGVFILPSRVDDTDSFEGYPLALLEASACGTPIIGGRGCGAEHLIQEGDNGFLIAPGDIDGLVSRLALLFSNPERSRLMGQRAKAVAEQLSWTKNADQVMEIYDRIMTEIRV